uniref:Uncharacterized protein n=1 Tax=Aegilops tauschii subsp. strangulata TaxID=200361 RepID=A0A453M408_AEGTS
DLRGEVGDVDALRDEGEGVLERVEAGAEERRDGGVVRVAVEVRVRGSVPIRRRDAAAVLARIPSIPDL